MTMVVDLGLGSCFDGDAHADDARCAAVSWFVEQGYTNVLREIFHDGPPESWRVFEVTRDADVVRRSWLTSLEATPILASVAEVWARIGGRHVSFSWPMVSDLGMETPECAFEADGPVPIGWKPLTPWADRQVLLGPLLGCHFGSEASDESERALQDDALALWGLARAHRLILHVA
jgi:hypothetical protein